MRGTPSEIRCRRWAEEVQRNADPSFTSFRDYREPGKDYCGLDFRRSIEGHPIFGALELTEDYLYTQVPTTDMGEYGEWKTRLEGHECEFMPPHRHLSPGLRTVEVIYGHARCPVASLRAANREVLNLTGARL